MSTELSTHVNPQSAESAVAGVIAGIRSEGRSLPFLHNFAGSKEDMLELTFLAIGGGASPGGEMVGKRITFTNWYIHAVELTDNKTGEISVMPRVVLITADRKAVQFVSDGVAQSLDVIIRFVGSGDLGDGFTVEIQQRKTRKGRTLLMLKPVRD